jgi:pSer/pThr/pTyr-binding forkhead associated (FHA) protein
MMNDEVVRSGEHPNDKSKNTPRPSRPTHPARDNLQPTRTFTLEDIKAIAPAPVQFPPPIFEQPQIAMAALKQSNVPLEETTYLAIGGGLGSFAWVDHLVIHGVKAEAIVCIGFEQHPYSRFRRLCEHSQISGGERLRSDSGATPDNIWGWPGYALREIWRDLKQGNLHHAAYLAWQIFSEPVLAEPFTPQAGDIYASLEREAARIGWEQMWRFGRVQTIRKTDDERYVVAYSQSTNRRPRANKCIVAPYLHLAVGYPGFRFLPDLQAYREQTRDFRSVVNAYEDHDHIYDYLQKHGGVVLIRGRGIVASRILQRLYEERLKNPGIHILHLMQSPKPAGPRYKRARRLTEHHFDLQPYNFPKSCFGGDFLFELEQAGDRQRADLIDLWGGTTTAKRRAWQELIKLGLNEGWYQIRFGQVEQVKRNNGKLVTVIAGQGGIRERSYFLTDFIIDATGLDADLEHNPLLRDLLCTYQLDKSVKGKLKISDNFEVAGLQNGRGRVFASGAMTLGGPFAPVDSFVGLQYAAQRSMDQLIDLGAPGLHRLNPIRSASQWLRWTLGVRP